MAKYYATEVTITQILLMATTIILFYTVVLCYLSRQARWIFVLSIPLVYNIYI